MVWCVKRTQWDRTLNKLPHIREAGKRLPLTVARWLCFFFFYLFCSKATFYKEMGSCRGPTELHSQLMNKDFTKVCAYKRYSAATKGGQDLRGDRFAQSLQLPHKLCETV